MKDKKLFIVYTDKERRETEREWNRKYSSKEIGEVLEVTIKKDFYTKEYYAIDSRGATHNVRRIDNPKARQKYLLTLNPYGRQIKAEKIK